MKIRATFHKAENILENTFNHIGVFDSGVGGLTIAQAIEEKAPHSIIHYCSDNKNFPYGPRSEDEILEMVSAVVMRWQEIRPLGMLVVACNTASTLALPYLRESLDIPVVGVVPAIKPASLLSQSGIIGLLATPGTITRQYTKDLIEQFAPERKVIMVGSSRLVEIAEEKLRGGIVNLKEISEILKPFFEFSHGKIDQVILGCTHFPWLLEELLSASKWPVNFVDSSMAVASRVRTLLLNQNPTLKDKSSFGTFYYTKDSIDLERLKPFVESLGFTAMTSLQIDC